MALPLGWFMIVVIVALVILLYAVSYLPEPAPAPGRNPPPVKLLLDVVLCVVAVVAILWRSGILRG